MRFLPPLVPIFIYTRHAESSIFISDTFTYIYIHGEKENFTPQSDLIRKRYAQMQILGVGEKSYRIRRMMNSCNREREIELSNYRSKYRRSTNEERFPAIGADGKSDR